MPAPGVFAQIEFDAGTLMVLSAAFSFLYAAMTAVLARSFPPEIAGLREGAMTMLFVGLALLTIFASILSAENGDLQLAHRLAINVVVGVAAAWYAASMFRLTDRAVPVRLLVGLVLANALLGAAVTFVVSYPAVQRTLGSLFIAAIFAIGSIGGLRWPPARNSITRLALCLGVLSLPAMTLLRLVVFLFGTQDVSVMEVNAVLIAFSASVVLATLCGGLSAPLLASQALQENLARLAATDALTGLFCRRAFFDAVEQRLAEPAASRGAVLMIDVDRFKQINDTHGHQVGDRTIAACAQILGRAVREGDVAARYGGEEFIAFVDDAAVADSIAKRVIESARRTLSTEHPPFTVSIGVAHLGPGQTLEQCIGRADAALYRAKQGGRDRMEMAD